MPTLARAIRTTRLDGPFLSNATGSLYDWTEFDFDSQHSGNNTLESTISTANVNTLQKRFQVSLPSVADGAPVYLTSVNTSGGVKDLIFVTTRAGHIVALDAFSPRFGRAPVWYMTRRPTRFTCRYFYAAQHFSAFHIEEGLTLADFRSRILYRSLFVTLCSTSSSSALPPF